MPSSLNGGRIFGQDGIGPTRLGEWLRIKRAKF
jgi:hypothetical protein